jgi:hypothetical protein
MGTSLKHSFNHCVSLRSIYGFREDQSKYWIHTALDTGTNDKCMLLYRFPTDWKPLD